jgi:hypothetical protein
VPALFEGEEGGSARIRALDLADFYPAIEELSSEGWIPSPSKCAPLLEALNLDHRQIVEAALICTEAIGRTKPHPAEALFAIKVRHAATGSL